MGEGGGINEYSGIQFCVFGICVNPVRRVLFCCDKVFLKYTYVNFPAPLLFQKQSCFAWYSFVFDSCTMPPSPAEIVFCNSFLAAPVFGLLPPRQIRHLCRCFRFDRRPTVTSRSMSQILCWSWPTTIQFWTRTVYTRLFTTPLVLESTRNSYHGLGVTAFLPWFVCNSW